MPDTENTRLSIAAVTDTAEALRKVVRVNCTPGRETQLALTKIDEAVMWAEKAIRG